MSIIYEALQKIERRPKENATAEPRVAAVHHETISSSVLTQKKPRSLLSVGITLCFLLLLGIYFLRIQSPIKPLPVASTKVLSADRQPQPLAKDGVDDLMQAINAASVNDPAQTYEGEVTYTLQGIIYDEENPLALINGKKVGLGDRIGDALVLDISGNGVELLINEEKKFLPLE
ncbi:MAG: hypothetical protein PHV55_01515 [Candidatus Omnitrophica bacterium]|nr:hypothetical protein [Candidatus Omnitrophota bacterium]